jgi:hypothetical protein
LGVELGASTLVRQVLYNWSYTLSPFCVGYYYFGGREVLWFELRSSHLWGRYSTAWAMPPISSGYFGDRVLVFAQAGLDCSPPALHFLPSPGWQAHATTPSFFLLRWGLENFFAQANPALPSSWSQPPA